MTDSNVMSNYVKPIYAHTLQSLIYIYTRTTSLTMKHFSMFGDENLSLKDWFVYRQYVPEQNPIYIVVFV